MTITLLELNNLLADDIDHVDGQGAMNGLQYINNAGKMLCNMYGWRWLNRAGVNLGFTANQAYVLLPTDMLRLESVTPVDLGMGLVLVDFRTFMHHEKQQSQPSGYFAYVGHGVGTNGAHEKRLHIYPTPDATESNKIKIKYRGGWNPILSGDVAADRIITIPDYMEVLFLEVFRAYYMGYEEDANAGVSQRVELVKNGRVYKDAIAIDVNFSPYETLFGPAGNANREPAHIYHDIPT